MEGLSAHILDEASSSDGDDCLSCFGPSPFFSQSYLPPAEQEIVTGGTVMSSSATPDSHPPRHVEIFDFKIPFPIFTELIDMRDHLLHLPSLSENQLGESASGKAPMSKARSEATVTKYMNRWNKARPVPKNASHKVTPQELFNYVYTHSERKIRMPYALCEILLNTNSNYVVVNHIVVERDVFEAILQCRLHEEEGGFAEKVQGCAMGSHVIEQTKSREHNITASPLPPLSTFTTATTPAKLDAGVGTSSCSNQTTTQKPVLTCATNLTSTSVSHSGMKATLGINNAVLKSSPLCNTTPSLRAAAAASNTTSISPTTQPSSGRFPPPFRGYEAEQVASIIQYRFANHLGRRVSVPNAVIRILYGMPERGRTMKIGGTSGWGKS
jgi:hypothetical protein